MAFRDFMLLMAANQLVLAGIFSAGGITPGPTLIGSGVFLALAALFPAESSADSRPEGAASALPPDALLNITGRGEE